MDKEHAADSAWPRRWCPAGHATPTQLREYWASQEALAHAPRGQSLFCAASSARSELDATRCSTHKESSVARSRCSRSAGWLVAATPGGMIVHLKEFRGAESLGQRYFFLGDVLQAAPEVEAVVHDDACHLRKYVDKRARRSPLASAMAHPRVKYVIDRFHAKGHKDPWCLANCMWSSPENEELIQQLRRPGAKFNDSICEQLFSKLGRHKFVVSKMGMATSAFYLNEVAELRNLERLWASRVSA